ncbi:DUF6899 family protein [Bradyrhizobium sp. PMVTL-01]|uniref:DUF6899 family protein n=1 Tax=Bradyrhizobium sp. PMVTL-01 TaxID=3434999 RepID=UPI003F6EE9D8
MNDVLGALDGAKAEFYRRVAAPYEDAKIADSGDVYPSLRHALFSGSWFRSLEPAPTG